MICMYMSAIHAPCGPRLEGVFSIHRILEMTWAVFQILGKGNRRPAVSCFLQLNTKWDLRIEKERKKKLEKIDVINVDLATDIYYAIPCIRLNFPRNKCVYLHNATLACFPQNSLMMQLSEPWFCVSSSLKRAETPADGLWPEVPSSLLKRRTVLVAG